MSTTILGGWTPYTTTISADAQAAFNEVIAGLVGVHYTPLAVASQVVSGMNYRFFCNAQAVHPDAPYYAAIVQVYRPIQGKAVITSIKPIE